MISGNSITNTTSDVTIHMDCKSLLQSNKVDFEESGHYFIVGTISPKAGWLLHLSGIESQFYELLYIVVPFLIESKSPFSVIKNKELARNSLDGLLGYGQAGKLISVYPETEMDALALAKKLISLTSEFRGPAIPTDFLLKGIVYTLYAVYDNKGDYSCHIPPRIPDNVVWPFNEITLLIVPVQKTLWNDKYRPHSMIKDDLKGRVIMANYFKSLFNIKLCVIKEGVRNAWSDRWGRDIIERLKWQFELYTELAGNVNTPHIFDFFYENGNAYLVMEYIKGDSLDSKILGIYNGNSWHGLAIQDKHALIDYLLKVILVVQQLHDLGYVHRDITPANFLIGKQSDLFLIDMELTYSLKYHKPEPAFRLGTPGFASPEQLAHQVPTVKEDIYSLGALMLCLFTGLPPVKFEKKAKQEVTEAVYFFSGNYSLADLITSCLADDPDERPTLAIIRDTINTFKQELRHNSQPISGKDHLKINEKDWCSLINDGLKGLVAFKQVSNNDQWESLREQDDKLEGYQPIERFVRPGFHTGVAGIVYLLSRAKKMGYNIEPCRKAISSSVEFIEKAILTPELNIPAGFHDGLAGISLAMCEGKNAGLLPNTSYVQYIEQCYMVDTSMLNLANGIAGQGLSLLQCKSAVNDNFWRQLLEKYVQQLLTQQQKDGSWNICRSKRKPNDKLLGLSYGMAGLLYFLIEYNNAFKNEAVAIATKKGLDFLIKYFHKKRQDYYWNTTTKSKSIESCRCNIGVPGIALVFIKAYACYGNPLYKKVAENALYALSSQPVYNDFTQASGLSGLGEVYLEAMQVFMDNEWQKRAEWIARLFFYTFQRDETGAGFWSVNANPDPEPDLMTGNCGILHFLMRYLNESSLPYILTSLKPN